MKWGKTIFLSCFPVGPSVRMENWALTERIFMKFDIWVFFENLPWKIQVWLKSDKNNGQSTRPPMYIYYISQFSS